MTRNTYYDEMSTAERIEAATRQGGYVARALGRFTDVKPRFRVQSLEQARFHAERQLEAIAAAIEAARRE